MGENAGMGQGVGSFLAMNPLDPPRFQCVWILNIPAGTLALLLVSAKVGEASPQDLCRPRPQAGHMKAQLTHGRVNHKGSSHRQRPSPFSLLPAQRPLEKI